MPRVNQVKSLRELCIEYVSKIVEDWTEEFQFHQGSDPNVITLLQQGEDEELYNKYVKPMLDMLPSTLLADITVPYAWFEDPWISSESKLLWCYMRMLFFGEFGLVIEDHQTDETLDGLLQVASNRCPLLISLVIIVIHYNENVYNTHKLETFLPRFQKLQKLEVPWLDIEDSCLEVLGAFCKDLRTLDVTYCKKVTDAGIKALCVSVDHMGKTNETLGQCKSIVKLETIGTEVTIFGIHIGLKNLPNLIYWDMISFQTLIEMQSQMDLRKEFVEIPKCFSNCSELEHGDQHSLAPYTSGSLKMVLPFCPFLSKVHITTLSGFMDADLLCLVYLEKLRKLEIHGCELSTGNEITFDDGIIPLLQAKGPNLIELKLAKLRTPINISTVTELCPNLHTLYLSKNHIYTSNSSMFQPKFEMKKLELLDIESLRSCEIPSENLAFLLSSPLLKRINVELCDTLTDDHLLKIGKVNRSPLLLRLHRCNSITEKGVNVIMQENEIYRVFLISCRNISQYDAIKWEREALQKNLDLYLVYH